MKIIYVVKKIVNTKKSIINTNKNASAKFVKISGGGNKNKMPTEGEPNSTVTAPNGNQRTYGPDGKAKKDTDYSHPERHPELKNPHYHDWDWSGDKPVRGKPYDSDISWGTKALGVGLITVSVVGIILVAADDATVIGVADDFLFGPLGGGVAKGMQMVFG